MITGTVYETVIVAWADAPFAAVATIEKKFGLGVTAGAVNFPVESIAPALADQITLLLPPFTVALNCWDEPGMSVTDVGEIATDVPTGTTVPIGMSGLLLATLLPLTTSGIVIVTNWAPIGAFAGTTTSN